MRLLHTTGCHSRYIVTASALSTMDIQLPSIQRELCEEHVEEIVAHQKHLHALFGYFLFTGSITLCKCDGTLYNVDGQHRAAAAKRLYQADPMSDFELVCEVIQCKNIEQVEEWFQLVNSNRPLPSFLLKPVGASSSDDSALMISDSDSGNSEAKKTQSELLREMREHVRATYGAFLSKAKEPNRPNVHLDVFVEEVGKRYDFVTILLEEKMDTVGAWLDRENAAHGVRLESMRHHEQVVSCLEKIKKKASTTKGKGDPIGKGDTNPFYLGCYFLDSIKNKVPAQTRHRLWKQWYGGLESDKKLPNGDVLCPCCEVTYINAFSFEAGHKVSFQEKGGNAVENLIPLCGPCNRSMGVLDYDVYRATIH